MFRKFTQWFDSSPYSAHSDHHTCHFQGCQEAGSYRAPKSRYNLDNGINDWNWFCLIHIRDYNGKWNYYKGMNEQEITTEWQSDVTWDRPSWPLGQSPYADFTIADPFGLFSSMNNENNHSDSPAHQPFISTQEEEALKVLDLSFPFTSNDLRQNYRRLAKTYHPDCNGGSQEAQEKILALNKAYSFLKDKYR